MLILLLLTSSIFFRASDDSVNQDLVVKEWLALEAVDGRGRRPFRPDAVFSQYLLDSESSPPKVGEILEGELGKATWVSASADDEGNFSSPNGAAWAYAKLKLERDIVLLADLQGASTLFLNGVAFSGDPYRFGYQGYPVALRKGDNHIFVTGTRGNFQLAFHARPTKLVFADWTSTTPHLLSGGAVGGEASVALMNLSTEPIPLLYVVAGGVGPFARRRSLVPWGIEPLGVTRVPVDLLARDGHQLPEEPEPQKLYLSLGGASNEDAQVQWLDIGMKKEGQAHLQTFRSGMDNTVQQFGLVPPAEDSSMEGERGLVISLHGASVKPMSQANCFTPKKEWWIACPTNRSPYGFDWQDWGRLDAYEVRDLMLDRFDLPRDKVALTGHSMGGHGAWHLAVNNPDAWCAVAPSAGWCSFDTYGSRPEGSLKGLWFGADGASDTLGLLSNLQGKPLYVLHGEADDNVPVSEAKDMMAACEAQGIEFDFHLEPGAGHWWGNQCMDWPGIFETFAGQTVPQSPLQLDFRTADPGIDSAHHWVTVEQFLRYGEKAHLSGEREKDGSGVVMTTENVRYFRVNLPLERATIDGQKFSSIEPSPHGVWFVWSESTQTSKEGRWQLRYGGPPSTEKSPNRTGPFKRAFDKSFVLIYGTIGSEKETEELLARARYDSEIWFYRANGHARLCSDREFLDPDSQEDFTHRNIILYGNTENNAAWDTVLADDHPIQVSKNKIRLGSQTWKGDDLGATFVLPRKGEHETLVAAFASTGIAGARLGYTLAPFISGVGYPDYTVFNSQVLQSGDDAILAAGWWNEAWKLKEMKGLEEGGEE
ncbi:MAG: prolyl oligopeptidase family serine peptidase [Planctomycetota bacterium]|nr:prolyl oligopeptidase family serine peptidase [Planctomycetota bacterium]|tara:strand:- start:14393 stop:16861 length:2469 start_codon:yes stop_codon:yes gene_type:complete